MKNNPSEVYNYLQRPVRSTANEGQIQQSLLEHYPEIKKYTINGGEYYSFSPISDANEPQPDMGCSEKIILYNEQELLDSIENQKKPKACALLKLPKHGNIKQVQSEAMALGLSATVFGLTTASATMVNYEEKPALFVPFDNMQPLTKIAIGEDHTQSSDKPAFENSTIEPIGNGLAPNVFLEDFGKSFGLMYLCGDPDAVGRNNQNKGFIDRNLYVFDQAIFTHEYPTYFDLFILDSRLCQTPSTYIGGLLRHTRGRNYSLLEDASIDAKFASLDPHKLQAALEYCDEIIRGFEQQTNLSNPKQAQNNKILLAYARHTKNVIQKRINKYLQILPKCENINNETVKNALIFEKIVNKPKLFTDISRPYRNLTTTCPHKFKINKIVKTEENNVKIFFDQELDTITIARVKKRLGPNNVRINNAEKSLTIPENLLNNLEKKFYPETTTTLENDVIYFSKSHVEELCKTYNYENSDLYQSTRNYERSMAPIKTIKEIVDDIKEHRKNIEKTAKESKDLPLYQHLIKCFEFDAQQKIQQAVQREFRALGKDQTDTLINTQNQAFSTAIKLDCIIEFNNLSLLYANNINDQNIVTKTQELFSKYSNINDQEMTVANAVALRKEFIDEIKLCLNLANTQSFRGRVQKITGSTEKLDEVDEEATQNKNPKA